eukprot:SM000141S00881  [mRNA]  locus=s141:90998:92139:- [translate_table: standard]
MAAGRTHHCRAGKLRSAGNSTKATAAAAATQLAWWAAAHGPLRSTGAPWLLGPPWRGPWGRQLRGGGTAAAVVGEHTVSVTQEVWSCTLQRSNTTPQSRHDSCAPPPPPPKQGLGYWAQPAPPRRAAGRGPGLRTRLAAHWKKCALSFGFFSSPPHSSHWNHTIAAAAAADAAAAAAAAGYGGGRGRGGVLGRAAGGCGDVGGRKRRREASPVASAAAEGTSASSSGCGGGGGGGEGGSSGGGGCGAAATAALLRAAAEFLTFLSCCP